jgi:hypothetical protein
MTRSSLAAGSLKRAAALVSAVLLGAAIREGAVRRGRRVAAAANPSTPQPLPSEASEDEESADAPAATPTRLQGAPSSILANRIAIDRDGAAPTLEQMGLQEAKKQAFAWQQQRSHARLNDLHGHLSGRPGGRWVKEVHGIFGVVAEQILISIEAESEKVICGEALASIETDAGEADEVSKAMRAHYQRSLRFFAEGQANALVIACHGLANLVLRSIEFDAPLTPGELKKIRIKAPDFTPRSEAKSAWISMAKETLDDLSTFAAVRSPATQSMVSSLRAIYDEPEVSGLIDLRNVQYHRWRGETAGVTGLDRAAETVSEVLLSGRAVTVRTGPTLPEYVEGQETLDQVVASSRKALDAVVLHLESLHEAWFDAFEDAFSS